LDPERDLAPGDSQDTTKAGKSLKLNNNRLYIKTFCSGWRGRTSGLGNFTFNTAPADKN
jgi:hypothetical protein